MNDQPIAGLGDNIKTLITGQALSEYLNATYAELLDRTAELILKAPQYLTIENDADDEAATEFLVALRACWSAAEAARVAEKRPYDDNAGIVQALFKKVILDPLGAAPENKMPFDPVSRTEIGLGPRIAMAQTIFKQKKVVQERMRRDEEARLARAAEAEAARKRAEEERAARAAEDKARLEREAAERERREEEDRIRRQAEEEQRQAEEAARQAELSASRKRNEETRKAAEAKAATDRANAEVARKAREANDARVNEERRVRDEANRAAEDKARLEREERERLALEAENRAAEARAAAEAAANAPAADMSRARGDRGGVSSLRTFVNFRDLDRNVVDLEALRPYFKEPHLEMAVRAYHDANKATVQSHIRAGTQPVKGVVFYEDSKSASRA